MGLRGRDDGGLLVRFSGGSSDDGTLWLLLLLLLMLEQPDDIMGVIVGILIVGRMDFNSVFFYNYYT